MSKKRVYSFTLVLAGVALIAGATTFPGSGTGAIPDRGASGCGPPAGPPLDITFNVAGEPASTPTQIGVEMDVTHSWVGDVTVMLIAPDGTTMAPMFGRTKATTDTSCGDSSDLAGTYGFYDLTPNPTNWWDEATANTILTPGNYRATEVGGAGQIDPAPFVDIDAAFAGVADPNGTWTLRVTDSGGGDTGTVNSATLFLGQNVPVELMNFSIE